MASSSRARLTSAALIVPSAAVTGAKRDFSSSLPNSTGWCGVSTTRGGVDWDIPTTAPGGIANTGIGFVQVMSQVQDAPPPPPATAAAHTKKSQESNGVIAMMDLLVKDLDKEMAVAEVDEKNAQEEYEQTVA